MGNLLGKLHEVVPEEDTQSEMIQSTANVFPDSE